MPAAPRITPQDPSLSPTYDRSATQTEHSAHPSIRRNLFSAHLSRRPVTNQTSNLFASSSPVHHNARSPHDVFSSGPKLHPTKRAADMKDIYDPNVSPQNHNATASNSNNLFPRESIIAVNPLTGRPLLPNLPTLPPRLRLSEDDEEKGSDEEIEGHEYLDYGNPYSRSPSHSRNFLPTSDLDFDPDIDLDSSDLNFIGVPRSRNVINSFIDTTDSEDGRRDRERIERLLAEMMNKQRARARTLVSTEPSNSMLNINSASTAIANVTRSTRGGKARERKLDTSSRYEPQRPNIESTLGGVGATMDPVEKDELMGLIMTSLRRKLQQAEDEGWMYGGAEGLGGIGTNTDLGGDGIYE